MALSFRVKMNWLADLLLGAVFIIMMVTGLTKFPGFVGLFGIRFSSLPVGQISALHDWCGIALIILVLVHLMLHLSWIKETTKEIFGFSGGRRQ